MEHRNLKQKAVTAARFHLSLRPLRTVLYMVTPLAIGAYLPPEQYGLFAATFAVIGILEGLCLPGTSLYLIRMDDEKATDSLLWFNVVTRLALAAGIFSLAGPIATVMQAPQATPLLRALSLWPVLEGLRLFLDALLTRHLLYGKRFVSLFTGDLMGIGAMLLGLFFGLGVWSLLLRIYVTSFAGVTFNLLLFQWRPTFTFQLREVKSFFPFNSDITVTRFVAQYLASMDSFVVSAFCGPVAAGLFSMSAKFALLPLQQVFWPAGELLLPFGKHYVEEKESLADLLARFTATCLFVCLPFLLALDFLGGYLPLLLGQKWLGIESVVHAFCLIGAMLCFAPPTSLYVLAKATRLDARLGVAQAVLMTLAIAIGSRWGINGATVALVAATFLSMGIRIHFSLLAVGMRLWVFGRRVLPVLLANFGLGAYLLLCRQYTAPPATPMDAARDALILAIAAGFYLFTMRKHESYLAVELLVRRRRAAQTRLKVNEKTI